MKIIFPEVSSTVIILGLALAAAAYTIPGGLSSVVHTEVIQAVLLILGSVILTYFCLTEVGGWSGMMERLTELSGSGYIAKEAGEVFDMAGPIDDP